MKLSAILAALLAIGLASVCHAQPLSSADSSVEWKAAHSRQIVRAVISQVTNGGYHVRGIRPDEIFAESLLKPNHNNKRFPVRLAGENSR